MDGPLVITSSLPCQELSSFCFANLSKKLVSLKREMSSVYVWSVGQAIGVPDAKSDGLFVLVEY